MLSKFASMLSPLFAAPDLAPGLSAKPCEPRVTEASTEAAKALSARYPGWDLRAIELYEQELDRRAARW